MGYGRGQLGACSPEDSWHGKLFNFSPGNCSCNKVNLNVQGKQISFQDMEIEFVWCSE